MGNSGFEHIGTLAKLHGYKGEFLLLTEFDLPKNIQKWESVFIEIDGIPVPFFISSLRITSESSAIIGFDDFGSSDKAKPFIGCRVLQVSKVSGYKPKINNVTFEGYKVFDIQQGYIGTIESIVEYSQNILFRIMQDNQEILIPASEEYIQKVDDKRMELYLSLPNGLLELFK